MNTLYRKYRPKNFSSVVGQRHIIQTLSGSAKMGRIGNAYLLTGPRGTGKTTLARIFAKTINCQKPISSKLNHIGYEPCNECENCSLIVNEKAIDLIEIDAASHTGVDNIRQLKESVHLPPSKLKYKVFIIDEVHMLSIGAFNALLKTLEEPPIHTVFILATTELHKIPETIISRCQRFDISHLNLNDIRQRLTYIIKEEGFLIEPEALDILAIESDGGMRDAESLLGQILSIQSNKKIKTSEVQSLLGISPKKHIFEFINHLAKKDLAQSLQLIEKLHQEGVNLINFNKNLLEIFRKILLLKVNPSIRLKLKKEYSAEQLTQIENIEKILEIKSLILVIDQFQFSLENFKTSPIPQLPLEIATIKIAQIQSFPANLGEVKKKPSKIDPVNTSNSYQKSSLSKINLENKTEIKKTASNKKFSVAKYLEIRDRNKKEEVKKSQEKELPADKKTIRKIPLEKILYDWNKILDQIKTNNRGLHSLLVNTAPYGSLGDIFFIRTDFSLYKETLNQSQNKLTIADVIDKITGVKCEISFLDSKSLNEIKLDNHPKIKKDPLLQGMLIFGGAVEKNNTFLKPSK